MKISRRGFFGLLGGAIAVAVLPKFSEAEPKGPNAPTGPIGDYHFEIATLVTAQLRDKFIAQEELAGWSLVNGHVYD